MFSKKIIVTIFVAFATIFSIGFFSPTLAVANENICPVLNSGDMIKIIGKPAIYVLDDNLNYEYFPDGDVFKSWNKYETYNKYYKAVSQECFDSLQSTPFSPFHAFYRAGSYLVKNISSENLFVVGLSNKLYPILNTAAKAIFGNNYIFKNIGLSEWPSYIKESTIIDKAEVYPGMLFKTDNKTYFTDEQKVLHEVTPEGMIANRFKTSFIKNLSSNDITDLQIGEKITSEISSLTARNEKNTGEYLTAESSYLSVSVKTVKPQPMSIFTHVMSVSGEVTNPEKQKIIEQGIVWDYITSLQIDTRVIPTVEKNAQKVVAELGQNKFDVNIFGLPASAYPYIRAYAITEDNTVVYGKVEPINKVTSGLITYGTPALPITSGGGGSTKTYTLNYTAGSNGTVTGTLSQTVNHGSNGTAINAVPVVNYHFVNWSDGVIANPRIDTNVTANITATATFTIDTFTLSYIPGAGGAIIGSSTQVLDHNTNGTTVTATPNTGYHFVNWSDGNTTSPRTDTSITADLTVTANFAINTYTLTYNAGSNGSVTGTSPQTVNHGADGSVVTATPNTGYHFVNWSDGNTTSPRTDINVTADISVTANFAINTYTVIFDKNGGDVDSNPTSTIANYNTTVTLPTTNPTKTGHTFAGWNTAANGSGSTFDNTIPVTANITVYAQWTIDTFTLTYSVDANGSITGSSTQVVDYNTNSMTVTATPDIGYHFVDWQDGILTASRTDTNVTADIITNANFEIDTFTLTYTAGANGSLTGSSTQVVDYNTNGTTVIAVPAIGYHFVNWSDSSTTSPRTDINVTADISVTANFTINTYTVIFDKNGGDVDSNPTSTIANYNTTVTLPATEPTKTGHTFTGWDTAANGSGTSFTAGTNVVADITVYAQWTINTYTVTFDQNTGDTASSPTSITTNYNTTVTLPATEPTKTGHTFTGWNTAANGSGTSFTASTNVVADITVYAQWTINTYTVTFDQNTGDTASSPTSITTNYNTTVTLPTTEPTKTGHTFAGWNTAANGSGTPFNASTNVVADITVYAQWTINTYTLTYTADVNGSLTGSSTQSVNYGASSTAVSAVPDAGYYFVKWSDGSIENPRIDTNVTGDITVTSTFDTFDCGSTSVYYAGEGYPTVQIGDQCWLGKNLNVGIRVDADQFQDNNSSIEKYCYDDDENNCNIYGGLYQWHEIMALSDSCYNNDCSASINTPHQGICPDGWHVPTYTEWNDLDGYLSTDTGGKLKATGTAYWNSPNTGASDTYGFRALGAGWRKDAPSSTLGIGEINKLWTSTPVDSLGSHVGANLISLNYDSSLINFSEFNASRMYGSSARCLVNKYTLTYTTATVGGTIIGTTTQNVFHHTDGTTVTATPNSGYIFTGWSDGVTTSVRTELQVTSSISVTASFQITTRTLTYSVNSSTMGYISGSSTQVVNYGADGTSVTAKPNSGYIFKSWADGLFSTDERQDANVTTSISVTANFEVLPPFECSTSSVSHGGGPYATVQIGSQCWFKKNLNVGIRVNTAESQASSTIVEKYCYGNDEEKCDTYGGLYEWAEAMNLPFACNTNTFGNGGCPTTSYPIQGICPDGWHVPSSTEFDKLIASVGDTLNAGGYLKVTGTDYWETPNTGALDTYGFSALGSGYTENSPSSLKKYFQVWSSTVIDDSKASSLFFKHDSASAATENLGKTAYGFSVRCVKD